MNYAYNRVSTENQNLENQKIKINPKYNIDKWYFEKKVVVQTIVLEI